MIIQTRCHQIRTLTIPNQISPKIRKKVPIILIAIFGLLSFNARSQAMAKKLTILKIDASNRCFLNLLDVSSIV